MREIKGQMRFCLCYKVMLHKPREKPAKYIDGLGGGKIWAGVEQKRDKKVLRNSLKDGKISELLLVAGH